MILRSTFLLFLLLPLVARADQVLDPRIHHLRWGDVREWSDFPEPAESHDLVVRFDAPPNPAEQTLRVRHRDLKQIWTVKLNGKELGSLPRDENEMVTYWSIPAGLLKGAGNELRIACLANVPAIAPAEGASDDVMIGEVQLLDAPRKEVLSQASADVTVTDADSGTQTPCRITIVDAHNCLIDLGNQSDNKSAVRPGVFYTVDGHANLHLPAGSYTIYAGRGFACGIDSQKIDLKPGESAKVNLKIRREVKLPGYVSCDTHIHTFTYSHHGDATLDERLITLAGEDVQLPISTDHNLVVDYAGRTKALGLDRYFTPVIGEEVTTAKLGHFNVFPLTMTGPLPDWRAPSWKILGESLAKIPGDRVVILNHARDIHGGFRPFDPARHLQSTGEDLDGWDPPANAMEIINSGSTQTDPMQLIQDWFGVMNGGKMLTPIGASDSHDVTRYIVGQGRTYVRNDAAEPGKIDVAKAVQSLREGRVLVSFGLVADLQVAGKYGPGDLVPASAASAEKELAVRMRVLGPGWTSAQHVTLFANGKPIYTANITHVDDAPEPAGLKWEKTLKLPVPKHDQWLVLVATGPGVTAPYWPIGRPYQPTSPDWKSYVLGVSGAVKLDADGSGTFESSREYAQRIFKAEAGNYDNVVKALENYDEATASQAACLLRQKGSTRFLEEAAGAFPHAGPIAQSGMNRYWIDWQLHEKKQISPKR